MPSPAAASTPTPRSRRHSPACTGRPKRGPMASRSPARPSSSSTKASTPARSWRRLQCRSSPTTTPRRCTNGSRWPSGRCSSRASGAWRAKASRSVTGRSASVSDDKREIRRALVSVYDKTGLEELARGLHEAGVALVSTGSTASRIADAGVPVTPVEELTGFPECLDGRVKTLHPKVHAGILADLRKPAHEQQPADLGVQPFDLVVVNLYPFVETVASGATPDECVEQIDIGGPSMVRAAAKNHPSVAVVVDPTSYDEVLAAVQAGGFDLAARR